MHACSLEVMTFCVEIENVGNFRHVRILHIFLEVGIFSVAANRFVLNHTQLLKKSTYDSKL